MYSAIMLDRNARVQRVIEELTGNEALPEMLDLENANTRAKEFRHGNWPLRMIPLFGSSLRHVFISRTMYLTICE
jgi:hypothetical protein